jgi:hypothetical protein
MPLVRWAPGGEPPSFIEPGRYAVDMVDVELGLDGNVTYILRWNERTVMDPNATLIELARAINGEDWDAAKESLEALAEWRHKGGFRPSSFLSVRAQ